MAMRNQSDWDELDDEIVAEINMTPLIDIMLVLLILFMVTSSVSLESGLDIDLPKTSGQREKKGPEAVVISLDDRGEISVMGEKSSFLKLEETLKEALRASQKSLVILEGDRKATLGRTIEIMDIAKRAGALKFAIAAEGE